SVGLATLLFATSGVTDSISCVGVEFSEGFVVVFGDSGLDISESGLTQSSGRMAMALTALIRTKEENKTMNIVIMRLFLIRITSVSGLN
ncbi:MAG: hypothetical protein Q8R66_02505, partial [Methanobacteriaceae archaeon]|nr:hypothetical protein [Methanobacteriaceae archaeon]